MRASELQEIYRGVEGTHVGPFGTSEPDVLERDQHSGRHVDGAWLAVIGDRCMRIRPGLRVLDTLRLWLQTPSPVLRLVVVEGREPIRHTSLPSTPLSYS